MQSLTEGFLLPSASLNLKRMTSIKVENVENWGIFQSIGAPVCLLLLEAKQTWCLTLCLAGPPQLA